MKMTTFLCFVLMTGVASADTLFLEASGSGNSLDLVMDVTPRTVNGDTVYDAVGGTGTWQVGSDFGPIAWTFATWDENDSDVSFVVEGCFESEPAPGGCPDGDFNAWVDNFPGRQLTIIGRMDVDLDGDLVDFSLQTLDGGAFGNEPEYLLRADANDIALTRFEMMAVPAPEPSSVVLLVIGLLLLARRRRNASTLSIA